MSPSWREGEDSLLKKNASERKVAPPCMDELTRSDARSLITPFGEATDPATDLLETTCCLRCPPLLALARGGLRGAFTEPRPRETSQVRLLTA